MNERRETEARYSDEFSRTESRRRRRSTLLGILFGSIASLVSLIEGVHAWHAGAMVDMGPRFSFAKYPPSLVIVLGLVGLAVCGCCLWLTLTDRRKPH